ncbi:hypothetical protein B566_EDAN005418 [Ephemera danica]|nr:hypothetical protein B566_EDAN005418 [Ephemera danica]
MSKKQSVRPKQAKHAKKAKLQTNLMPPFTESCKNKQSKTSNIKKERHSTCSDDSSEGSLFDEEQDYLHDVDCVWESFHLAEMVHSNELWDVCLRVVQCKSSEALKRPGLVESTLAQLLAVLRSDELTVTSELEVIEACLRWGWLTEAEKLSIFMYICTKDSKWFCDTLCTNTELRRLPENVFPKNYELVLSNADTSFKHNPDKKEISTYFYIDNIINLCGVTIYSQIDHEDVISKSNLVIDPQAMKEGYIENVRVKLRNPDQQIIGINCAQRVAYNSTLQITFPEPIKLDLLCTDNKKNRYQLIILLRESGWYPMHKYPKLLRRS